MENNSVQLKEGIKLHLIKNNKYKTNLVSIMITTKLNKDNVTKNALIPVVLRRGSKTLDTQEKINKYLEEMYGASIDCGLDKNGDNHVIKFYIETINDEFIPNEDKNILKLSIETLLDIVFNPYIENNGFKNTYVEQEKNYLKQIIKGRVDNKSRYALDRCIEEMYKNEAYGLYKYGNEKDLDNINEKDLYNYYLKLINEAKIDIFISGNINDDTINFVKENNNIKKLKERKPEYIDNLFFGKKSDKENIVTEKLEVNQGKLVIGLDVDTKTIEDKYAIMVYNAILGGTANSKLFQNVREKESLAYSASSVYYKVKNNIFINCGIEINNYKKALKIIKKQIEDMNKGMYDESDIENAKNIIISSIKSIEDEQDTEIVYFFGQELSKENISIDSYIKKISDVSEEDIERIAKKISINTIYFLKNK